MFTSLVYILLTTIATFIQLNLNQPESAAVFTIMADVSVASSTGSQHGSISPNDSDTFNIDFDPVRDEAICSTIEFKRDFKRSNPLPELRDTAKKYGRWSPRRQGQDVIINTSALAQAFPDFSQAGSPNDTFSLELPRGRKGKQRTTTTLPSGLEYVHDAKKTPSINLPNNLRLMQTPKQRDEPIQPIIYEDATRNTANVRKNSNNTQSNTQTSTNPQAKPSNPPATHFATEQKENIPPLPHQANQSKKSSYTSNASRTISGDRRTLKELHARVADESDGSIIGTERPASVTFQPKNTRFSKTSEKKPSSNYLFTPASTNGKAVNATQHSFFVASALQSATTTQTNVLPTVHNGKVVNGGKSQSFESADNFELPEEEEDIYEYARKLKAQVAMLEKALAAANDRMEFMEQDNAQAAAMRVDASRKWEVEQDQIYAENEALKEEARVLRSQLAREKDNVTLTWEKQEFARKNQVDQMIAEKEDNERAFQKSQAALQRQIDSLLSEKQESARNTRFLQNQQSLLKNQVDQLRRENDTTRSLQGQHSTLQNRINQLLREKEEQSQIFEQQQAILRRQVDQLLQEKEQYNRDRQQIENTHQIELQRHEKAVEYLSNITEHLRESTQTQRTNIVTSSRMSKSTSGGGTKRKSSSRIDEQDLPSKVMKQAQNHIEGIQAASVNLHSNQRQISNQQLNHNKKGRATSQALDFNLHQQVFGHNLQQPQNTHIAAPREQNDDTQMSREASIDDNIEGARNNVQNNIQNNTQNITQASEDDSISDVSTNWSSILGHGFKSDIQQHLRDLKAARKRQLKVDDQASVREDTIQSGRSSHAPSVKMTEEQHAVRDDTFQTIQSGRSSHAPSVKGPSGILKNTNPPNQEDLTGRFSIKSAKSNDHTNQDHTSKSKTHRRHHSMVEEDHTTKSNTSHRRHHSETTIHTSTRRQKDGDDMTSAYLVADIDAAKQRNGCERPVLSATARQVLDGLCEHNRKNCTICLRLASHDTKSASKTTIQIQKPVPVSQRAPSPVPYEDEPTLRPSVAPGIALATVLKCLEDEVAHLKMKHAEKQQVYMEHDASLGRRERKAMKVEIDALLSQIDAKSDHIYHLYDVLEGQRQAGQEMSVDQIELTLNKMDLDMEEEELPWEGIEESN